jgi:hypothetical protein
MTSAQRCPEVVAGLRVESFEQGAEVFGQGLPPNTLRVHPEPEPGRG